MIELARRFLAPTKSAGALSATEFLDALEERFPLIGRLAQTPQDPVWHGEGNVRIHTEMVLDEIKPLALRRGDEEEQVVLVLGAALHDIGKTLTTAEDRTGERLRIVSPRHPAVGRNVVAPLLGQAGGKEGLTSRQRHQLLGLIGESPQPEEAREPVGPAPRYARLSRAVDSDLVTVLEQADIRGRICADLDKQLEVLELFGLAAREHGTWKADPYEEWAACFEQAIEDPGQVDYVYREAQLLFEEGVIQSPEEALGKTYVHRSEHPEVVLTCGPAGVGKSTWIQRELPEYEVISLDALREELTGTCRRGNKKAEGRMMQEALERFRAVLRRKGKVVWDATSLWRDSRARLVRLGRDYHAFTRIVVFPVPESEALRRNRGRPNAVPKEVIQNHYQGWEWPEPWEAHHVDVVDEY